MAARSGDEIACVHFDFDDFDAVMVANALAQSCPKISRKLASRRVALCAGRSQDSVSGSLSTTGSFQH